MESHEDENPAVAAWGKSAPACGSKPKAASDDAIHSPSSVRGESAGPAVTPSQYPTTHSSPLLTIVLPGFTPGATDQACKLRCSPIKPPQLGSCRL